MRPTVFYLTTSSRSSVRYAALSSRNLFKLKSCFLFCTYWNKACNFPPSGERGAGLGQHIWAEHHEHGEGAWLPASRWAGGPLGELTLYWLFPVCGWPGVSGPQSHPGRYRHESDTPHVFSFSSSSLKCIVLTVAWSHNYSDINFFPQISLHITGFSTFPCIQRHVWARDGGEQKGEPKVPKISFFLLEIN